MAFLWLHMCWPPHSGAVIVEVMKAIVLSFERLAARFLGCYGNDRVHTPQWDRLAAMATVFDHCLAGSPEPDHLADWWTGCHHTRGRVLTDGPHLLDALRAAGVHTRFICESPSLLVEGDCPAFDSRTRVSGISGADAEDFETPFAQLVAEGCRQLQAWQSGAAAELLWLHSQAIPVPWIPPQDSAAPYFDALPDEDDEADDEDTNAGADRRQTDANPTAPDAAAEEQELLDFERFVCSGGRLTSEADWAATGLSPSDWSMSRAAYTGYISLIDGYLGTLLDAILESNERLLLIVTSATGQRLRNAESWMEGLAGTREEDLHCPLLVHDSGAPHSTRRADLVQNVDVPASLLEWFDCPTSRMEGRSLLPAVRNEASHTREYVCFADATHHGIRSQDFALLKPRESVTPGNDHLRLFVKPDDYWEVTNLWTQYPESTRQLEQTLLNFESACNNPPPADLPSLATEQDRDTAASDDLETSSEHTT